MDNHEQCRALLASLSDFVDGVLEQELCAEIEKHMSNCENCRIVVDTLRKTVLLYQQTNRPASVPAEVRERLYRKLDLTEFLDV
ncbi:MAG TPA: zf-HC2 domain-containing protein [Anaerolineales bacterium]|nr:zf-HC2 domain-containing protein [Anaerolineales bacterium]